MNPIILERSPDLSITIEITDEPGGEIALRQWVLEDGRLPGLQEIVVTRAMAREMVERINQLLEAKYV